MGKCKYGFIYFYVHFIVEIVTFYILSAYMKAEEAVAFAFGYDFLAFVLQGFYGYLLDKNIKVPLFPIGIILCVISIVLFRFDVFPILVITVLSIGNGVLHICGAERTLRCSPGTMTNSALFVSGGSFGIIIGKILSMYNCYWWIVVLICLTLVLPMLYCYKHPIDYKDESNLNQYNFATTKIKPWIVILLATLVVAVRAYIGYGIPTSWNKELYQTILLYFLMGLGKALGGILVDKLGIRISSLISVIGSIPFLVFGDKIMIVSLFGVLMFSMTMPITLAIIQSCMKKTPGIAFGMTTIGLFIGTVPALFYKIDSLVVNAILIAVLSIFCAIILLGITKPKGVQV